MEKILFHLKISLYQPFNLFSQTNRIGAAENHLATETKIYGQA
jgi:hypothetical protein